LELFFYISGMGLEKLSKLQVGIGWCMAIQIYAMPLNGQRQNQNNRQQSIPFWMAIARSTKGGRQLDGIFDRLKSKKAILPVGAQGLGAKGEEAVPNRPKSKKAILPIFVQSLGTSGEKRVPNRPKPVKNVPSKLPAEARDVSGAGENSASVSTEEKDNARETFSVVSRAASNPTENIAAPCNENQSERVTIPADYKLYNVPGDGLCGYWATLTARKAKEAGDETSLRVERKEVFELLRQLSDCIAYTVKKENKTDQEVEMVNEIDQLLRDGYAKDYEDLYQRIERGQMQLDSPLALFLAQVVGYNIILEWEGVKSGRSVHVQERYRANNAQGIIIIYYSGNGSGGHYQAIIPSKINVVFN
jgi:hypothetical protein